MLLESTPWGLYKDNAVVISAARLSSPIELIVTTLSFLNLIQKMHSNPVKAYGKKNSSGVNVTR